MLKPPTTNGVSVRFSAFARMIAVVAVLALS